MPGGGQSLLLLWILLAVRAAGGFALSIDDFHVEGTQLMLREGVSGSIPPEVGSLVNLTRIDLHSRGLSGTIPPELGNLTELVYLDLSHNDLGGPIPAELGKLSNLASLNLSFNSLAEPIPPQLGNLRSLVFLNLFANRLSGGIPPQLGDLTNLQYLSLPTNNLSGPIPPELGKLANLRQLYLYENHLTGAIIEELGDLTNLVTLSLSNNSLNGPIPSSLGNYRLATVLLANNSLSGEIPAALVTRLKSNVTYVCTYIKRGNPDLTLDPTIGQCPTSPPEPPPVSTGPAISSPLPPPAPVSSPPPSNPAPLSAPPTSSQGSPSEPRWDLGKVLALALALPTGLISFGLTVAFFVVEVRKHRKAKQAIVGDAISLCETGARFISSTPKASADTFAIVRPSNMGDQEMRQILETILGLVLQRLEAWPKCLGIRGDPTEAIWSSNFRRFEHYALFRALADVDAQYKPLGLLQAWRMNRTDPQASEAIIDKLYDYLQSILHTTWVGRVEAL